MGAAGAVRHRHGGAAQRRGAGRRLRLHGLPAEQRAGAQRRRRLQVRCLQGSAQFAQGLHLGILQMSRQTSVLSCMRLPAGASSWTTQPHGVSYRNMSVMQVPLSIPTGRCWRWRSSRRSTTARRGPPGRASCSRGWRPTLSSESTACSSCSSTVAAAVKACAAPVPGSRPCSGGSAEFGIRHGARSQRVEHCLGHNTSTSADVRNVFGSI